jgi:hypothetical protein
MFNRNQRRLGTIAYQDGALGTLNIPRDTFFTKFTIRMQGYVTYTFTGSPIALPTGLFDAVVTNIKVTANGNRVIKSVRPYLLAMNTMMASTQKPRRCSVASATAPTNLEDVTADANFTYGTTGQSTSYTETLELFFETPHDLAGEQGLATVFRTRGLQTAELALQFGSLSVLEATTPTQIAVTYTVVSLQFLVTGEEVQDLDPANYGLLDYVQSNFKKTYTGQVTNDEIDINRSGVLLGIDLLTESNVGRTGSVEALKKLNNKLISDIAFKLNGVRDVITTRFKTLQDQNINKFKLVSPFVSNVSPTDGYAFIDFMRNRQLNGGLDLRKEDSAKLIISTNAGIATILTYNADLTVQTHELRAVDPDNFKSN